MSINIQESFQKMALGEKIILVAAPLFFIDSFLPWFKKSYDLGVLGSGTYTRGGWSGGGAIFTILAVIIAIAMLAVIILSRFTTVKLPVLPQGVTWARLQLGGGIAVALLVLIRLVIGESVGGVDLDLAYGIFIAIILAAALAAGGALLFMDERKAMTTGTTTGSTM